MIVKALRYETESEGMIYEKAICKKDAIQFKFAKDQYDSIRKAQIYVNDKQAATFKYETYSNYGLTINLER